MADREEPSRGRLDPLPQAGAVDVRAYGALGDGVRDDTAAVQAAIDRGGITFFPPGDYACGSLTMRRGSHLVGTNSGTYTYAGGAYQRDYPASSVSRLVRRPGTNRPLVHGPAGAKHVVLEDLQLDGNNSEQTQGQAPVVALDDCAAPEDTQWVLSRCYLHGRQDPRAPSWGQAGSNLYIGAGRMGCHLSDCVSTFASRHGVEINGADAVVRSCILGDNGAHGIVIGAWATTVTGCAIYNNTDGIHVPATGVGAPKRVLLSANGIDRNRRHGVLVDGEAHVGASGVSITGNAFTTNSTDRDGAAAHICILATSGQVVVGGNVFSVPEAGYRHRTSAGVYLGPDARAVDMGNVFEGGSVHGFSNAPEALEGSTRLR